MVRSKAPKQFWDNCLKREAYVRSLTALGIYKLNGQVPETVVSGEIADFLLLVQFGFFTPCPIWMIQVGYVLRHLGHVPGRNDGIRSRLRPRN